MKRTRTKECEKMKHDEILRVAGKAIMEKKLKNQSHGQAELTHRALDSPRTTVSVSFVPPEGNTYVRCKQPCRDRIER